MLEYDIVKISFLSLNCLNMSLLETWVFKKFPVQRVPGLLQIPACSIVTQHQDRTSLSLLRGRITLSNV